VNWKNCCELWLKHAFHGGVVVGCSGTSSRHSSRCQSQCQEASGKYFIIIFSKLLTPAEVLSIYREAGSLFLSYRSYRLCAISGRGRARWINILCKGGI
jgi:hypothetical protein